MSERGQLPVLVVGAGPAGLATAAELSRRGITHLLVEGGNELGYSWANLYDSLTLHTGKHMSALPGMRFPRETPLFPTRQHFLAYLRRYAATFKLEVRTGFTVQRLSRDDGAWVAEPAVGQPVRASAVVMATGIIAGPRTPDVPGRELFQGRVMHSSAYRRPAGFEGHRVLIVGVGNSGGEIGSELAEAGAQVTIAVRSGANVVPLTLAGIPIQYLAYLLRKLPRAAQEPIVGLVRRLSERRRGPPVLPRPSHGPLDGIPLIGFHLVDTIRAGRIRVRGAIDRFTATGVRFADGTEEPFDDVVFCTGFAPALGALAGLVRTDARGFALRRDRVTSSDQPSLYFVGHNYDATGGLNNIRIDAGLVAARLASSGAR